MRHFLRDDDISAAEQQQLLQDASSLKSNGLDSLPLNGRSVALVLEKESTRSRMSFQVGIAQLGANPVVMDAQDSQLARGETIGDTARVLSRYVDAIVLRTLGDDRIQNMAQAASVPVINALTDGFHPCQVLADLQTINEEFGTVAGQTVAFVGDGANNMAHSYLLAAALAGAHLRIATPAKYQPNQSIVDRASVLAAQTHGSVEVTSDCRSAVRGAHVVATDTWMSMGQRDQQSRLRDLAPYQLNSQLLSLASPQAIALHCLPAHRGEEITDEVMDGPQSRIFDQTENRLHAQKALLRWLIAGELGGLNPQQGARA